MFTVSLVDFLNIKNQNIFTYNAYASNTAYYLTLSNAQGIVVFCCSIAIADANAQGFNING